MPPVRLLIADDDEAIRRLLALKLRAMGAEVLEARDGEEAVTLALELRPDGVFLDVLMPKRNGFEALAEMRSRGYDGRAVMVTALGEENARHLQAGEKPDFVLAKPFRQQEVRACLELLRQSLLAG